MATPDSGWTIVPSPHGCGGERPPFRNPRRRFVEKNLEGPPDGHGCGFSFEGERMPCREGYGGARALLDHPENVGPLLEEARRIAGLTGPEGRHAGPSVPKGSLSGSSIRSSAPEVIMKALATWVLLFGSTALAQSANPLRGEPSQPVEPYRVIGNIYYVGAQNISSHIIVTSDGLILLDTGTQEMLPGIRANVEKLGYRMQDIKVILSSHAHWDHVEGHAAMKELTGAKVMAVGEDAASISSGTDTSAAGAQGWNPVQVDRVLKDGDLVTLGEVTMKAHLTPGHTKGCTAWTTTVEENGRPYRVVFVGGTGINQGVKLIGNTRHPGIAEDYARTFRVLKGIQADVFLAQHPSMYGMHEKLDRLNSGAKENPFIDPEGYRRFVEAEEGRYLKQLDEERSAAR